MDDFATRRVQFWPGWLAGWPVGVQPDIIVRSRRRVGGKEGKGELKAEKKAKSPQSEAPDINLSLPSTCYCSAKDRLVLI